MSISAYTPNDMDVVHMTSVDLVRRPVQEVIHLMQYDGMANLVGVKIMKDGAPLNLSKAQKATVQWLKVDGRNVSDPSVISKYQNRIVGYDKDDTSILYFRVIEAYTDDKPGNNALVALTVSFDGLTQNFNTPLLPIVIDASPFK